MRRVSPQFPRQAQALCWHTRLLNDALHPDIARPIRSSCDVLPILHHLHTVLNADPTCARAPLRVLQALLQAVAAAAVAIPADLAVQQVALQIVHFCNYRGVHCVVPQDAVLAARAIVEADTEHNLPLLTAAVQVLGWAAQAEPAAYRAPLSVQAVVLQKVVCALGAHGGPMSRKWRALLEAVVDLGSLCGVSIEDTEWETLYTDSASRYTDLALKLVAMALHAVVAQSAVWTPQTLTHLTTMACGLLDHALEWLPHVVEAQGGLVHSDLLSARQADLHMCAEALVRQLQLQHTVCTFRLRRVVPWLHNIPSLLAFARPLLMATARPVLDMLTHEAEKREAQWRRPRVRWLLATCALACDAAPA